MSTLNKVKALVYVRAFSLSLYKQLNYNVMYVITRKSVDGKADMFYRFSGSKKDLYCVATDNVETCTKYSEEEYLKLRNSELLEIRGVSFKKIGFTFS